MHTSEDGFSEAFLDNVEQNQDRCRADSAPGISIPECLSFWMTSFSVSIKDCDSCETGSSRSRTR